MRALKQLKSQSFAPINAARSGRFVHDDLGKARTEWLKSLPEPRRHIFDRRIIEPGDFVEVSMIQLVHERFHRSANFSVIVKPAGRWIDFENCSAMLLFVQAVFGGVAVRTHRYVKTRPVTVRDEVLGPMMIDQYAAA